MIKTKKVFMIIGIVLGAISLFVGGVIGVLAISGKFRNPELYPEKLEFVDNGKIIIEGEGYTDLAKRLYSFVLTGTNSDTEHEINNPNCKLSFVNNIGYDLIQLCDQDGRPLEIIEGTRSYLVECNKPIYFKLKQTAKELSSTYNPEYQYNGEVRLEAISEREDVKSNVLTFYIDRKIEKIYLEDDQSGIPTLNQQEISVVVGRDFEFNYVVNPEVSRKPISKIDAEKIVEVYYLKENSDDYILIDDDSLSNNAEIKNFMRKENGKLIFNSQTTDSYKFILAIFKTYADRENYLGSSRSSTDTNFLKLTNQDYPMVLNYVTIKPEETIIQKVEVDSSDSNVLFALYKENSIFLNKENVDNSLGIVMTKNDEPTNVRYDSVEFNSLVNKTWSTQQNPIFTNVEDETDEIRTNLYISGTGLNTQIIDNGETLKYLYLAYNQNGVLIGTQEIDFAITLSNIKIKDGIIIDYISSGSMTYRCSNGAAVLVENDTSYEIKLLGEGTYLDLYEQSDNKLTLLEDVQDNFIISSPTGTKGERGWTLVPKKEYANKNLVFGIFVVNGSGLFDVYNYFDYKKLVIQPYSISSLNNIILNNSTVLDITFDVEKIEDEYNDVVNVSDKDFSYFIDTQKLASDYTYNACAFVTPEASQYNIEVCDNVKFVYNGTTYVLVGQFDLTKDENDYVTAVKFNNKVISKDNDSPENTTTNLHLLQIRNEYQQTFEDYIVSKAFNFDGQIYEQLSVEIENGSDSADIVNIFQTAIKVDLRYLLNKDLISEVTYVDNEKGELIDNNTVYSVFSKQNGLQIILHSDNSKMFERLMEFYKLSNVNLIRSSSNNIEIGYKTAEQNKLIIRYNTINPSYDNNDYIFISLYNLLDNNEVLTLGQTTNSKNNVIGHKIFVKNSDPNTIAYKYENGTITLSNTVEAAINNEEKLKVEVSWEDGDYKYNYYNAKTNSPIQLNLNLNYLGTEEIGFVDAEGFKVELRNSYESGNEDLFKINNSDDEFSFEVVQISNEESRNISYLSVTMGSTTRYLGVVVTTDGEFSFESTNSSTTIPSGSLLSIGKLKYAENDDDIGINKLVTNIELICRSYGNGVALVKPETNAVVVIDSKDQVEIIRFEKGESGWTITRNNDKINYDLTLDIKLTTLVGTYNVNSFKFTSNTTANYNSSLWGDKLYYGTKINLIKGENDSGLIEATSDSGVNKTYYYQILNNNEWGTANEITTSSEFSIGDTLGIGDKLRFVVKFGEGSNALEIPVGEFTIVPNVIATPKDGVSKNSGDNLEIGDLFELSHFDTAITYGLGNNAYYKYNSTNNTYELNVVPLNSDDSLSLSSTNAKWVEEIGAENDQTVDLLYETYNVATTKIAVSNGKTLNFDAETYKIEVQKEKTIEVSVDGFNLESISFTIDGIEYSYTSNTFTFDKFLSEDKIVNIKFTFKTSDETKTLFGFKEFTFKPYCPAVNEGKQSIYTTQTIKLVKDLFDNVDGYLLDKTTTKSNVDLTNNASKTIDFAQIDGYELYKITYSDSTVDYSHEVLRKTLIVNENTATFTPSVSGTYPLTLHFKNSAIKSFVVTKFTTDEEGVEKYDYSSSTYNSITYKGNKLTDENLSSLGFLGGNIDGEISFDDIIGEYKNIYVWFKVTYTDAKENSSATEYEFKVRMRVNNRLTIEPSYPMYDDDGLKTSENEHFCVAKSNKDEMIGMGLGTSETDNIILINKDKPFEPILIYTDLSVSLDLETNEIKYSNNKTIDLGIERIKITNNLSQSADTSIKSIEFVAYSSLADFQNYCNNAISIDGSQIIFGTTNAKSGIAGLVVFKVTTQSGNYCFYCVYLYCNGTSYKVGGTAINSSNTIVVDSYTLSDSTPYSTIILSAASEAITSNFAVDYGTNQDNLKYYLISTTDADKSNLHKEVSDVAVSTSKYRTDILAVVLVKDEKIIHLGNITLNFRPSKTETPIDPDLKWVSNGYYTKELTSATSSYENPFNVDGLDFTSAKIVEIKSGNDSNVWKIEGNSIITNDNNKYPLLTLSDGDMTISRYVSTDLTFKVKYTWNDTFDVYVDYTLKAVDIRESNGESSIIVGNFNSDGFITAYDFDKLVKDYEKDINIAVNGEYYSGSITISSISSNIVLTNEIKINSSKELIFKQDNDEHEYYIKIDYLDIDGGNVSKTYKFYLHKGWNVDITNANGGDILDPVEAVKTEDYTYTQAIGSRTTLEVENHGKYMSYKIGGVTIYDSNSQDLTLSFVDANNKTTDQSIYVQSLTKNGSDVSNYTITYNESISEDTYYINFSHLAEEKIIAICLTLGSGDNAPKTYVYVKIAKTYETLLAKYLVDGTDHENILDDNPYNSFNNTLLSATNTEEDGNIAYNNRMRFVLVTGYDKGEPIVEENANFSAMGFMDTDNINYINLSRQNTSDSSYTINENNLTTQDLSTNESVTICLDNNAGMTTAYYNLQIMADHKLDGLDFGSITENQNARYDNNSITYVIDDSDSQQPYSQEFYVGTSLDTFNTSVFNVSSLSVSVDDNTNAIAANNITISGYTVTITYVSSQVKVRIYRASGEPAKLITITLKATGTTGYIAKDLTLKFYNYGIAVSPTSVIWAGDEISLSEKITNTAGKALSFKLDNSKSYYTVAGSSTQNALEVQLLLLYNETEVVGLNENRNITKIVTSSVSKTHYYHLIISVYDGVDWIINVELNFNVEVNLIFTVNGDDPTELIGTLETNFVLTNQEISIAGTTITPINKKDFGSLTKEITNGTNIVLESEDTNGVSQNNSKTLIRYRADRDVYYYNYLVLNAFKRTNDNSTYSPLDNSQLTVYCDENAYISVSNNTLTFERDYTGEFVLYVQYGTADGGVVETEWILNIIGINDYSKAGAENGIYSGSGAAGFIESNASESLIRTSETNGLIYLDKHSEITNKFSLLRDTAAEVSADYIVVSSNQSQTLEKIYTDNIGIAMKAQISGETTNMPYVPSCSTDSPVDYLVIYKVSISYSEYEEPPYYIACRVRNNTALSINTFDNDGTDVYGGDVVVDNGRLVSKSDETSNNSSTYLDLLYYKETYVATKTGGSETKIYVYYDGTKKVITDGTNNYELVPSTSNNTTTYSFKHENDVYTATSRTVETYYKSDDNKLYSVFKNPFESIDQFINYISNTGTVQIEGKYFTLTHLKEGRWGIDLNSWSGKGTGDILFTNTTNNAISIGKLSKYREVSDLTETDFNNNKTSYYTLTSGVYTQCKSSDTFNSDTKYFANTFTPVDTFETYSNDWSKQFRLSSSKSISMNGPGIALSSIFSSTQLQNATTYTLNTDNDYVADKYYKLENGSYVLVDSDTAPANWKTEFDKYYVLSNANALDLAGQKIYAVYKNDELESKATAWATAGAGNTLNLVKENGQIKKVLVGTITIGSKDYYINQIIYNVSLDSSSFYTVTKDVYVIESADGIIVNADFSKTTESAYFRANYDNASWDLHNSVMEFKMKHVYENDTTVTGDNFDSQKADLYTWNGTDYVSAASATFDNTATYYKYKTFLEKVSSISSISFAKSNTNTTITLDDTSTSPTYGIVSIDKSTLTSYKNANPTAKVYADQDGKWLFGYTVTVDGIAIDVNVAFMLPD